MVVVSTRTVTQSSSLSMCQRKSKHQPEHARPCLVPSGQWVWRPVCQCLTLFRRQDGPSFMPHGLGHSHRKGKKLIQTLKDIQDMCIHLVCPNTLICIFASSLHDVYAYIYNIYNAILTYILSYPHLICSRCHLNLCM